MKLHPDKGCAGKDQHDYTFQYVFDQRTAQRGMYNASEPPEAIIGMCKSCGDVYMVPVQRLARDEESASPESRQGRAEPNGGDGPVFAVGRAAAQSIAFGENDVIPTSAPPSSRW